jgi:hypothetical protein
MLTPEEVAALREHIGSVQEPPVGVYVTNPPPEAPSFPDLSGPIGGISSAIQKAVVASNKDLTRHLEVVTTVSDDLRKSVDQLTSAVKAIKPMDSGAICAGLAKLEKSIALLADAHLSPRTLEYEDGRKVVARVGEPMEDYDE